MRLYAVCLLLLCALACFDFSAPVEGGPGAKCGDRDHYCRAGYRCRATRVCELDCEGCSELERGDACASNDDCKTSFCISGVCCSESCDGVCYACNGPLGSGVCQPAAHGLVPTTGCDGRSCDGAGNCLAALGSNCASSSTCDSGYCSDGVCCNARCDGLCMSCASALTGTSDGICTFTNALLESSDECIGPVACNGEGSCFSGQAGSTCSADGECISGHCTDGVCCATKCDGICEKCNALGQCQPLANSEDSGTCDDARGCTTPPCSCGATGECLAVGGSCSDASTCGSGHCADGVCCNEDCDGTCRSCRASETGVQTGQCASIAANTDPANECAANAGTGFCDGGGACQQVQNGQACFQSTVCASGNCFGIGFTGQPMCCDNPCTGPCQSCRRVDTGVPDGQCANVLAGYQPPMPAACPAASSNGTCDGNGGCQKMPNGQMCEANQQCGSGFCVAEPNRAGRICCESASCETCYTCFSFQSTGVPGTCSAVVGGFDPKDECTRECDGYGACEEF